MENIKSIIICISLFAIVQIGYSQKNTKANPNAPEISFDKLENDYGIIKKGADGSCEFVYKNTGKEPLVLSDVSSSCGCTVPTWPKEPILSGKSRTIKVVYDTKKAGVISKTITVMSNAKNGIIILSIKGMVTE